MQNSKVHTICNVCGRHLHTDTYKDGAGLETTSYEYCPEHLKATQLKMLVWDGL